jgi:hypothetical protein
LSRIDFPLRGLPAHAQEEDHSYEWEEENWVMHKLYEEGNKEYKRFWKLQNNQIIHEYIHSVHSDFGMQRTFKKRGSQWYLNYYAAMNRLY